MADPTLDEIATALYAGAPDDFVSARTARATEIASPELAKEVRALKKPSVAAWVVNVFAQERADQLGQALQLAAELREAQDDLDAPALAKLGRDRRQLTRRLAETAADLAESRGERVTSATREAVEQTISAAFFDPDAAAAVASGRLVRALEPTASADDIRASVVGEVALTPTAPEPPADELKARRLRRDAERRLNAAEKDLAAAERELARREKELRSLQERADDLSDQAARLERELDALRTQVKRVHGDLPDAERERGEASEKKDAAASAVDEARQALDEL
ncbi:transposase [Microbacterium sp. 179-I 3D3 NHS]|uniref:transposase n=1 Tax=Microbacterium sp. 179-I 3D3 NHS TaxID=3142382 RepID=UPI0039A17DE6